MYNISFFKWLGLGKLDAFLFACINNSNIAE